MINQDKKIIPMTYDRIFKSVLMSPNSRNYLIELISEITGIDKK